MKEPIDKGGWSIFHTWLVGPDMVNPAVNFPIRGTGEKAWFGWPTDAKMEELREAWFNAPDAASSKKAADAVQARAFEFVPIIPTGPVHPADRVPLEHLRADHRADQPAVERGEEVATRGPLRNSRRAIAKVFAYVVRRLAATIVVMAVVALFVFSLLYLTPGDPAAIIAGDAATSEDIARIREKLGLDEPFLVRFGSWAVGARCTAISASRSSPTCRSRT